MKRCYHFIGIGGIGMSSLAMILLERGNEVSGSDLVETSITKALIAQGAKVKFGQSAENISPSQTVVFSTGISEDNPEFKAAIKLKCEMEHRSDCLVRLMQQQQAFAVAGTHGKTSTSALLAWTLDASGLNPSFSVGGILQNYQTNGKHGTGQYFVAEADESDGSFTKYNPDGAIITNIGLDHMEHYRSEDALLEAFQKFLSQVRVSEYLFWCGDDVRLKAINPDGISYGFDEGCQVRGSHFRQKGWNTFVDITFQGMLYSDVEVALSGKHNASNALAVFGLARSLGIDVEKIREAFKTFKGVGRRCEKKGEVEGILFLDDYAHHPTEIKATLSAIRQAHPTRRLVVVFQPHRYSRTRDCIGTYGTIFQAADQVVVTDIHAAGEEPIPGVEVSSILKEIDLDATLTCCYFPRKGLAAQLPTLLKKGDIVVTLGAGNITKVGSETLETLIGQHKAAI